MTVGERIKQRRTELGLTQLDLALRMGYTSKAAICKAEKESENMTSDRVTKFAKALNTTEAYLMGWDETLRIRQMNEIEEPMTNYDLKVKHDKLELFINYLRNDYGFAERIMEYAEFLIDKNSKKNTASLNDLMDEENEEE